MTEGELLSSIKRLQHQGCDDGQLEVKFSNELDQFRVTLFRAQRATDKHTEQQVPPMVHTGSSLESILACLATDVPTDVHTIANKTGLSLSTVRAYLSRLVEGGKVVPTASATSKRRKYLLVNL